jgi:hypothetical protein
MKQLKIGTVTTKPYRVLPMIHYIKIWWYYSILHKVLLDENGNPYDRKGVQVIRGEYFISDEWSEHSYLGRGYYISERGILSCDMRNPFYLEDLNKSLIKFKGLKI